MSRFVSRLMLVLTLTAGMFLLVVPVANAYIDPGAGSIIFQAIIAGAMAAGLAVKVFWRRVKALFTRSARPAGDRPQVQHERPG